MTREVRLFAPGLTPYHDAWRWQRQAAADLVAGGGESLALLEHPPVYTLGRRARREHLLAGPQALARDGAEVIETDRGGDVTYHGPGQLIAYPILNLRRRGLAAADYVRRLEDVMLRTAARCGVPARRQTGRPGVWCDDRKLGAVGVRVNCGVSLHGLALNVSVELSRFDAIVPCGLHGFSVTSLERELGYSPGCDSAKEALLNAFCAVFDSRIVESPLQIPPAVREEVPLGR
jgi:lipoate-protein ligase B